MHFATKTAKTAKKLRFWVCVTVSVVRSECYECYTFMRFITPLGCNLMVKPLYLEINVTQEFLMRVGYRRVSTIEQNLDRQELGAVERVFEDKASGKDKEREQLQDMLSFVRAGDELVVYSIDRLARDLRDLQSIITQLNEKGVSIEFLSERLVFSGNSDDAFAKLQLQMMGAFAEFERNIIRKRQAEGIAKAKERGVYENRKRKRKVSDKRILDLKQEGLNNTEIAEYLGISRMTVHRAFNRVVVS